MPEVNWEMKYDFVLCPSTLHACVHMYVGEACMLGLHACVHMYMLGHVCWGARMHVYTCMCVFETGSHVAQG